MSGDEAIKVLVRVRPALRDETGAKIAVQTPSDEQTVEVETARDSVRCQFDHVFDPHATQADVYAAAAADLPPSVVEGYNGTLFAYGQTGSGKTYTVFGDEKYEQDVYGTGSVNEHMGIIPRAVRELFLHVKASPHRDNISVYCSFLQIYNEQVFDLLQDGRRGSPLEVREDSRSGIYVEGLSEYKVGSSHDCLQVRVGIRAACVCVCVCVCREVLLNARWWSWSGCGVWVRGGGV